jgi:hypothetical protein
MAARKKTTRKKAISKPARTAPSKSAAYKIEAGVTKPKYASSNQPSQERLTLEKLKVGQSFAVPDLKLRKRIIDICYRMRKSDGRVFSVRKADKGLRVWRDK